MSAPAWRRKLTQLGADQQALIRVHYAELADTSAAVEIMRNTVRAFAIRLIVWDSALSLISRTARSENDDAEVGRVFDRLRVIIRDGPAGLIVDHSALSAVSPVSRGASAKFAALDVSYGMRLDDGSIPGPIDNWTSIISVEKDRHSLLGERRDRVATFIPLRDWNLTLDVAEIGSSTHRLSAEHPITAAIAKIAALDPPPVSGNDAFKRLGGKRKIILAAYKEWSS
jgi:hypothetical protein